ncbi:hypothetical protein [Helicobacter jaachi]|nr:hypothetical protein [Helicobacter jaachi]
MPHLKSTLDSQNTIESTPIALCNTHGNTATISALTLSEAA